MGYPLLDLHHPDLWPDGLCGALDKLRPVFRDWELELPSRTAQAYDKAVAELGAVLSPYAIRGYHFTRLTAEEAQDILAHGMDVLSPELLARRVEGQVVAGTLDRQQADRLLAHHQADKRNRAGMAWFCFYPPHEVAESGVSSLVGYWGGEALYWFHADDPQLGPLLRSIGRPALIEADVPVSFLSSTVGVVGKVVELDLEHQGIRDYTSPTRLEAHSTQRIPAQLVRRVLLHPDEAFVELTGCDRWQCPLE